MVVYGTESRVVDPVKALAGLRAPCSEHEAVSLLVELGEIEAGVADALCPSEERECEVTRALRSASVCAAKGAWSAMQQQVDLLARMRLPKQVRVSKQEGFAYYGLYPEMYVRAARQFEGEMRPNRVAVIGIRSIGTTLASLVAGALTCITRTFTVRPRGHPFDRYLALSRPFEAELAGLRGWTFAVVDEGPGLSGSSFASVARVLSRIGVPESRILLFPSWLPDGSTFVSDDARAVWVRLRKFASEFDDLPDATNVSRGRWHERRKYLAGDRLFKFAGLGAYNSPKLDRARLLARRGFTPPVHGVTRGFIEQTFVDGTPLSVRDVNPVLLKTMRDYLTFLRSDFPVATPVPFDEVMRMIAVNVAESLGLAWVFRVEQLERFRGAVLDGTRVAVDGRMLPHEWLRTSHGYVKTDALDHHDDHFFPGCQDIAWDIAGACAEFRLGRQEREFLSSAAPLPRVIPFYEVAYLAYRTGYTTLAGMRTAQYYARLLRGALERATA